MVNEKDCVLFGGSKGWKAEDWTASDDRVRGGSSQSYLSISGSVACFHGTLDTKTLGGAGFASQRTTSTDKSWDLSKYAGIYLNVVKQDDKKYTFILKDEILPPNPENGREQSTISYEYDFNAESAKGLFVPWHALKPTYRGKEKKDAKPLDTKKIMRFGIMMRSFFDKQDGNFLLQIESIEAACHSDDLEKGVVPRENKGTKPGSWKQSNLVGLVVILSTTWALCLGYSWLREYDTSYVMLNLW